MDRQQQTVLSNVMKVIIREQSPILYNENDETSEYRRRIYNMRELIIRVTTIGIFFYIAYLILEYKAKNFIYEKYKILFTLIMMTSIYWSGFEYSYRRNGSYSMLISIIITIAGLGGYIIFQKNRIYFFKEIDKKLIMENRSEIIQIINDYKYSFTDVKSDITFANTKIVFENVGKIQAEECLSIIGNFLDKNRREYKFKDYLIYFIKGHLIPLAIAIVTVVIFFKLMAYK